jgi:hypothetical protein
MMHFRRVEFWLLPAILAVALCLRLWGIEFGLPHRYHIDEAPYVLAALRIGAGDLHITYPYNSPNLYEFMLTALYSAWYLAGRVIGQFRTAAEFAAQYRTDPTVFFLLARSVSAIISTATVALVYYLGKTISGKALGLIAAALLAVTFSHARDGHYAVTDTLVTCLTTASLLGTIRYAEMPERRRYLLMAGLAGGGAIGLKYLPAPVLLPVLFAIWQARPKVSVQIASWWGLRQVVILAIGAVAGYLMAFPALLLNFELFCQQWRQVWSQALAVLGNIVVDISPAPIYYLKTFSWGLGLPLLTAAGAGLLLWIGPRRSASRALLLLFAVGYGAAICVVQTTFARYALPLVPLMALWAAELLLWTSGLIGQRVGHKAVIPAALLLTAAIASISATNLARHNWLLTQTDTRTLALRWIEAHVPASTRIAVQWYGPPLSTADDPEPGATRVYDVKQVDPFDTRPETYDLNTYRDAGFAYLVINSWSTSFRHRDPEQNRLRRQFFDALGSLPVAAQFSSGVDGQKPPFVFEQIYGPYNALFMIERPGPTITIYELPHALPHPE